MELEGNESRQHDIDWEKAWRAAERQDDPDGEWADRYAEWLIGIGATNPTDLTFDIFLICTKNRERYEAHVRRLWTVGLLKAVLKQLGMSWEPGIQRAVEEQVANKAIPHHPYYDSFGAYLVTGQLSIIP